ncbi:MAG: RNA polymerase sigma factor [Pseudomonadota bacterium]
MSEASPVPALVQAARHGDGIAMAALYRMFAPVLHGILLSRMQQADADDLTQEVFETALRRLADLREPAAFPGWIVSIARRAAVDAARRRVPLTGVEIDAPAEDADHAERLDAERALTAIRRLPEAYRETLMLRLVEGLSGPEIADRTGLTAGSVRVNLHRGMSLLREALGATAGERGGLR